MVIDKMDIRIMKYFQAIVDEGSISNASRQLNIAQPALSRQMKILEDELGVQLFERCAPKELRAKYLPYFQANKNAKAHEKKKLPQKLLVPIPLPPLLSIQKCF